MLKSSIILLVACISMTSFVRASMVYEIDASPFSTKDAPISSYIANAYEKIIVVDPVRHVWGAYNAKGHLMRWGIATAGSNYCADTGLPCRTKTGNFRIYSLGNADCYSSKYHNAPMPYCMYFNGSEALHGSDQVQFGNASHGCVRMHVDDAKWLRYHFVEAPTTANHYQGTRVLIKSYDSEIF